MTFKPRSPRDRDRLRFHASHSALLMAKASRWLWFVPSLSARLRGAAEDLLKACEGQSTITYDALGGAGGLAE